MIDLYKIDSKGKIRHWHCEIDYDDECVVVEHGQLNGSYQERRVYTEENMSGRSIEEQLDLVMQSRAKKKRDTGYKESIEEAKEFRATSFSKKPLPMLAQKVKYEKVDWRESFVQRKYDGHRCIIYCLDGEIKAYTRKGLDVETIEHIFRDMRGLPDGMFLDGELYVHGYNLQKLGSLIKRHQPEYAGLQFMCYDMIHSMPFTDRYDLIRSVIPNSSHIHLADTFLVKNEEEARKLFRQFRQEGYEGAILRHGDAPYESGKRSKSLMKIKEFIDEEFVVVNIIPSEDGWARLVCVTNYGINFNASCHGGVSYKRKVYLERDKYIGKRVKVKFSHWTDEGKPFHPIAVCWHDEEI